MSKNTIIAAVSNLSTACAVATDIFVAARALGLQSGGERLSAEGHVRERLVQPPDPEVAQLRRDERWLEDFLNRDSVFSLSAWDLWLPAETARAC